MEGVYIHGRHHKTRLIREEEKQEEEEYQKYIQSCLKDVENLKFTQWQLPNFHDLPNLIHKFE